MINKLVENLAQMDYPADRLEVLLLVEEDDEETLGALRTAQPPEPFQAGGRSPGRAPHQAQGT